MRAKRKKNHSRTVIADGPLAELAASLQSLLDDNELTQGDVEEATGVDQATISRAKNGKLERMTEKVHRLQKYADMRKRQIVLSSPVKAAASAFLAVGGSEEELISSIRLATRLVLRHPPIRELEIEEH
jgi:transcriptional regulator with XRE-family HTH domain